MGVYVTARKNLKRSLQHRFEGLLQGNLTASGENENRLNRTQIFADTRR
jgi:hypothetical protein